MAGAEGGWIWYRLLMSSLWDDGNVLELDCGDACTILQKY